LAPRAAATTKDPGSPTYICTVRSSLPRPCRFLRPLEPWFTVCIYRPDIQWLCSASRPNEMRSNIWHFDLRFSLQRWCRNLTMMIEKSAKDKPEMRVPTSDLD
jgi:hypothetical protein